MHLYDVPLLFVLAGLALYTVFGGADFGAGLWQLLAGGGERGKRIRDAAHHALAPVWEANHVWILFVITVSWTAYPQAFASVASTLCVALFLAGIGIIFRGASYALRAGVEDTQKIDVVFVGSCTNGRISDLRLAAGVLKGRHVADGVRLMVVPGSDEVKREAEREGLDEIFKAAGADWREAGCSMCIAMNGDQLQPGQYAVSTSNRNFEGRQGKGGRTFLASPLTAAASAIAGVVADPRRLPGIEALAAVGGR